MRAGAIGRRQHFKVAVAHVVALDQDVAPRAGCGPPLTSPADRIGSRNSVDLRTAPVRPRAPGGFDRVTPSATIAGGDVSAPPSGTRALSLRPVAFGPGRPAALVARQVALAPQMTKPIAASGTTAAPSTPAAARDMHVAAILAQAPCVDKSRLYGCGSAAAVQPRASACRPPDGAAPICAHAVAAARIGHGVSAALPRRHICRRPGSGMDLAQWTRSWWVRPVLGHNARKAA